MLHKFKKNVCVPAIYPQPLLRLLLALQSQHDGLGSHRNDLQFVLFSLQLFLFVDHVTAQQTHIQQRSLVLGALVALREAVIMLTEQSQSTRG